MVGFRAETAVLPNCPRHTSSCSCWLRLCCTKSVQKADSAFEELESPPGLKAQISDGPIRSMASTWGIVQCVPSPCHHHLGLFLHVLLSVGAHTALFLNSLSYSCYLKPTTRLCMKSAKRNAPSSDAEDCTPMDAVVTRKRFKPGASACLCGPTLSR